MSNVINKVKNNKLIMSLIGIGIFLLCLPFINIIFKAIFTMGQLVGTTTRLMS